LSNTQDSITNDGLTTFYSRRSEVIMGAAFILLAVVGFVGNTYTILVMMFRKRLYTACTPYLISVSMADLVMTAVILPVVGINGITGKVFLPTVFCKWFSILYHDILATSWLGLAMVSVVRCAGVWTNNKCCLLDWTKTIISLTWLLPMTNITYFLTLRWSSEEHVRTGYICWFFCGVKEMLHDAHDEAYHSADSHTVFWLSAFYSIAPLTIMVISYSMICYKVRESNLALELKRIRTFNKHQNEVRFTRMIGIIFGNYITFTFIPSALLIFRTLSVPNVLQLRQNPTNEEIHAMSSTIISDIYDPWVYIIFFVPFVSNPFIYVLSNQCYRKAFKDFFYKNIIPKLPPSEERSKSQQMEMEERFN